MSRRRIPDSATAGDDGSPDPRLSSALRAHAKDPGRLPEVLAALHHVRVLAPVVAVLGDPGTSDAGRPVDKTSDIALPLLLDGAGRRAVPVFSCLETLARWDPAARPVPVAGPQAAAVALAEGAEGLVLDVAGPSVVTLGLPEVRALAECRAAVPAYDDERLAGQVAQLLATEPTVLGGWLGPGAGVDAVLTVVLDSSAEPPADPAADPAAVGARLAARLRGLALGPAAVRGMEIALRPGAGPPPTGRRVFTRALS